MKHRRYQYALLEQKLLSGSLFPIHIKFGQKRIRRGTPALALFAALVQML